MNTTAPYSHLKSANNKKVRCGLKAKTISLRQCPCDTCKSGKECVRVTWSREKLGQVGTIEKRRAYMNVPHDHIKIRYSGDPEDYIVFPSDQIEII